MPGAKQAQAPLRSSGKRLNEETGAVATQRPKASLLPADELQPARRQLNGPSFGIRVKFAQALIRDLSLYIAGHLRPL